MAFLAYTPPRRLWKVGEAVFYLTRFRLDEDTLIEMAVEPKEELGFLHRNFYPFAKRWLHIRTGIIYEYEFVRRPEGLVLHNGIMSGWLSTCEEPVETQTVPNRDALCATDCYDAVPLELQLHGFPRSFAVELPANYQELVIGNNPATGLPVCALVVLVERGASPHYFPEELLVEFWQDTEGFHLRYLAGYVTSYRVSHSLEESYRKPSFGDFNIKVI